MANLLELLLEWDYPRLRETTMERSKMLSTTSKVVDLTVRLRRLVITKGMN